MKTIARYCCIALLIILPSVAVPPQAKASVSAMAATVNANPITAEDFNWAFNRMLRVLAIAGKKVDGNNIAQVRQMTLQGLFKNELLFAENEALGMKVDSETVEQEFEKLKSQFGEEQNYLNTLDSLHVSEGTIRRQIMRGIAVRQMLTKVFIPEVQLEKDAAEKYFKGHPEEFHQPELVRVRHILVKVKPDSSAGDKSAAKEKLAALQRRLQKGEDFATVAREASDCASAQLGGDLGYFRKGQLDPVLDTVVFALEPQQLSGIAESAFGYHLLQVTEHKDPQDLTFAQVKEELEKRLILRQAQMKTATFVKERLASAEVKIYLDELKPEQKDKKDE